MLLLKSSLYPRQTPPMCFHHPPAFSCYCVAVTNAGSNIAAVMPIRGDSRSCTRQQGFLHAQHPERYHIRSIRRGRINAQENSRLAYDFRVARRKRYVRCLWSSQPESFEGTRKSHRGRCHYGNQRRHSLHICCFRCCHIRKHIGLAAPYA